MCYQESTEKLTGIEYVLLKKKKNNKKTDSEQTEAFSCLQYSPIQMFETLYEN